MNAEFFNALDMLEREKGISKAYMLEKVEAALVSAYKKDSKGRENVRVVLNPEKKDIKVYQCRTVVEEVFDPQTEISLDEAKSLSRRYDLGSVVETEIKTKSFGRISAQTAKQVIVQGIREAEREMIAKAYESKKEEIISAIVTKTDISTGNVVVDTGTSEAVLLKSEQIPGEVLEVGKHVKVFVTIPEPKVEEMREGRDAKDGKEKRGPVVTLSRTNPNFVKRLFEMEIPEIADGTVVINNVSREPGSRTKISVSSRNADVDAVGACIGTNGMRINKIVAEINNEKIDVVNYSELPEEYVKAALSPAKTISITPDPTRDRAYRVIVAPDQLSLAIGKAGQNVRLAARLTGFKIDIKDSAE